MNKFLITAATVASICVTACAQKEEKTDMNTQQTLVAYFSATGTTARVAREIADVTSGDLLKIEPQTPYTNDDLNWNDKQSRSSIEMNDPQTHPAIKPISANIADYDIIFIGYPIWWDLAPRVINTFIESYNLEGKVLIPFATSGGSSIDNSVASLKKEYPTLQWKNGRLLNRTNRNIIKEWIEKL